MTRVEITPQSTHIVSESKNGQTHNITHGQFSQTDFPLASPMLPVITKVVAPSFVVPTVKPKVTAKYGIRGKMWNQTHQGVDLGARTGTPVYASQSGEVHLVTTEPKWGNRIILKHENGYQTLYGHLNSFDVKRGDIVTAGQVIGTVGSTGQSTGPHLHFEIRKDGQTVNPEPLIF